MSPSDLIDSDDALRRTVWGFIEETEKQLRALMRDKCRQEWGDGWQDQLCKRYEDVTKRWLDLQARDKSTLDTYGQPPGTLLDYSTLGDLGQVMLAEWQMFRDVFQFKKGSGKENKKALAETIEQIVDVRNRLAHSRPATPHQLRRAHVACDEIRLQIAKWSGKPLERDAQIEAIETRAFAIEERKSDQKHLTELHQILDTRFDEEGLRTLCFYLSVEYDNLLAEGKTNKARELVKHLEYRECISELIEKGKQLRPDISWPDTPEKPRLESTDRDALVPRMIDCLNSLIDNLRWELAEEQYEPLGLYPEPEALPLAGIEADLLTTNVREIRAGRKEVSSARSLRTLGEVLQSERTKYVLLGEPGAGKTTTLKRLALYMANQMLSGDKAGALPLYVPLIDYGVSNLNELMLAALGSLDPEIDHNQLQRMLQRGGLLLLFDGLNEVPPVNYPQCLRELRTLMRRYSRNRFVVTDRPTYDGSLQASVFKLSNWKSEQIRHYIYRAMHRLDSQRDPDPLINRVLQDQELYHLLANPLLLGLLTVVYHNTGRIAPARAQLYYDFIQALIARDRQKMPDDPLDDHTKERLLVRLAFAARQQGVTGMTEAFVREHIAEQLQKWQRAALVGADLNAASVIDSLRRGRWLRDTGTQGQLRFNFDILQDLFAALALKERFEKGESLAEFITDARWEEPVVLLSGLLGKKAASLVEEARTRGGIHLAARCVISASMVAARPRVVHLLRQELFSNLEMRRRSAAGLFIFLRAPEAVPDLVQALADENGAVRWNVGLAIQRTLGDQAADALFVQILENTEHSDETLTTACVMLGRSRSSEAVSALIRALAHQSDRVRRRASVELGRMDDPVAMRLLESAAREGLDPDIQAGAIRALSIAESDSARELAQSCLSHPSSKVRTEARLALGRLGDPQVITECLQQLETGQPDQQLQVVGALEAMRITQAIEPLWNLLTDSMLRPRASRALARIGGASVIARAVEGLAESNAALRRAAVDILGQTNDDRAIEPLVFALSDPDAPARGLAARLLENFGGRAVPALEQALMTASEAQEETQTIAILRALRNVGTRMAVQLLAEALDDPRPKVAKAAVRYLGQTDPEQARLVIREMWPSATDARKSQLDSLLVKLENKHHTRLALDYCRAHDPGVLKDLIEDTRSRIAVVRRSATQALGRTCEPRAKQRLIELMEDADYLVRAAAITALGQIGAEPESLDTLVEWVQDENQPLPVRVASAEVLGLFGGEAERDLLISLASISESDLAQAAGLASVKIEQRLREGITQVAAPPSEAWRVEALKDRLKNPLSRERQLAVEELVRLDSPEVEALLLSAAKDKHPFVRYAAIVGLGQRHVESAIPVLTGSLRDENVHNRRAALEALGHIGTPQALRKLGDVCRENETGLRERVLDILSGAASNLAAFNSLARFLGDHDEKLRDRAIAILGELEPTDLTPEHLKVIERILQSPNPFIRSSMLTALESNRAEATIPWIVACVKDDNFYVRRAAIGALSSMPTTEAIAALGEALDDWAAPVRIEAARALRNSRAPEAFLILRQAAHDEELSVVKEGLLAGMEASGEQGVQLLSAFVRHPSADIRLKAVEALADERTPATGQALLPAITDRRPSYRNVQLRAIQVAGELKTESADRPLAQLIGHNNKRLRESAAEALEAIGTTEVVPQLLKHLNHKNPGVVITAINLLGLSHSTEAALPLIARLKDDKVAIQIHAAQALGEIGDPRAIEPLAEMVKHTGNHRLRQEIISALGRIPDESATVMLIWALRHPDEETHKRAELALAQTEPSLVGAELIELLSHSSIRVRQTAAKLCGQLGVEDAISDLVELLKDANPYLQSAAALALGKIGSPKAIAALSHLVETVKDNRYVAKAAVEALAAIGSPDAVEVIAGTLQHWAQEVRLSAVRGLAQINTPHAMHHLARIVESEKDQEVLSAMFVAFENGPGGAAAHGLAHFMQHGEEAIAERAVEALARNGSDRAINALITAMAFEEESLRLTAIRAIGTYRVRQAIPRLIGALRRPKKEDEPTRHMATQALIQIGSRSCLPDLLELLDYRNPYVQQAACRVLGNLKATEVVQPLAHLLEVKNPYTRQTAAEALRQIASDEAVEELIGVLQHEDWRVRRTVLRAMGEMKVESAIPAIVEVLDDEGFDVRLAAVSALRSIGTQSAISALRLAALDAAPDIREEVLKSLRAVPTDSEAIGTAADGLCLLLADRDYERRRRVVEALATNPNHRAVRGLLQAVGDCDNIVRREAILALGERKVLDALEILLDACYDPIEPVRQAANQTADVIRIDVVEQLLDLATRKGKELGVDWSRSRSKAERLVERVGPEWVAQEILQRLDARSKRKRRRKNNPVAQSLTTSERPVETYIRLLGWTANPIGQDTVCQAMRSKNRFVRLAGIEAAGDMGMGDVVSDILKSARSPDSFEQIAAINALVSLGAGEAIPIFRSLVNDENSYTRAAAVRALGKLKAHEAKSEIQEALRDPVDQVRSAAVITLGEIGAAEVIPALIEALQDPNPFTRANAVNALAKLNATSAADEITSLLEDSDRRVAEAAIRVCGQLKLVEAIDPLVELRMQARPPLNNRASLALAEINSPIIVKRLVPMAWSTDRKHYRLAIRALARLELEEAHEALRSLLGHFHSSVRETVVEALKESHDISKYTAILCEALEDNEAHIRTRAIRLLVSTQQPMLQSLFEARLEDESPQVRQQAALALGRLGEPTIVPVLLSALEDEETETVRHAIFRALAKLGTPEALKALQYWRSTGDARTRLMAVAALQAERLSKALEETIARAPQERLGDPNPYIRQAAIRQVGEQGLVEMVSTLIPMLDDQNPYVCSATIEALGLLGDHSAVEPIADLAESPNPHIRSKVAEALGRLGDERASESLARLLEDNLIHVRHAAVEAILTIDSARLRGILARHLAQGEPPLATHIAIKIGEQSGIEWSEILLSGLWHEDEHVRAEVVQQLVHHSAPIVVDGIRQALSDPNIQVIREAIIAVGKIAPRELIPTIEEFLKHENSFLRAEAACTLGKLRATESLDALIHATHDPSEQVSSAAALALGQLGLEEAIPTLSELLGHPENQIVRSAIQALSQIQTPSAAVALRDALDHSDKFVREEVVERLRQFPPEVCIPHFIEAANDDNHFVREKAVEAMGISGQALACQTLVRALEDPNVYVRVAAAVSLGKVGCADALPALIKSLADTNAFVRSNAAKAIGRISNGEYQAKLIELLEDSNSHVRLAAITALARCPSHKWYASVADLAKNDSILSVRAAARQALVEAATPEAALYVCEIDQEAASLEELLQTPALQELRNQLDQYESQGTQFEDEKARDGFLACLTRAFLTNVPALHFQAGKLAAKFIHPDALPVYEFAMQDPLPAVRQFGAQALATIATSEALSRAQQFMATEEISEVRAALVRSLRKDELGEMGFSILETGLRDPDRAVVQAAVRVLAEIQHPRSIELLCSVIGHSSDFVREATVNALGRLKAVEALDDIYKAIDDPSWYVRQDAISALAQLGNIKITIEACRIGLTDKQQYVQLTAIETLRNIVAPESMPLFLSNLDHDHVGIRIAAAQGIKTCLGARTQSEFASVDWADAVTALRERFQVETNLDVRLALVDALDSWEPQAAVQLLQPYLFERSTPLRRKILDLCERVGWEISYNYIQTEFQRRKAQLPIVVRRDLTWAASRSQPQQCFQLLLTALGDSDEFVRANAAYGLGQSGDMSAVGPLTQLLRDPAKLVRETAYRALQSLAGTDGEPTRVSVETVMQDVAEESFTDPMTQLASWLREHDVQFDQSSQDTIREDLATQSLERFISQAASSNWLDRWYAVIALGDHPSLRAARALLRIYLNDENQTVQSDAGRMLREMPANIVQSVIESCLQSDDVIADSYTQRRLSDLLNSVITDA